MVQEKQAFQLDLRASGGCIVV